MGSFTFIDLFAGIGGFRLGLESIGGECVFSSEIEPHACAMYEENYGHNPYCDITKLDVSTVPDFDILCAGFPCQAFSICGRQKGFQDETRGTLFFDICRVLEAKKPKGFILENVANLEKHDGGRTLAVMVESLSALGYIVSYRVLNAKDFGVPQNRERIIFVGSRTGYRFDFDRIPVTPVNKMKEFLEKEGEFEYLEENTYTILENYKTQPKSGLIFIGYRNKKIRTVGVREGTNHLSRVHKQPNRIYSAEGIHPTIASQEQSGRYWIYVDGRVRKLTLNECFRFMGFPDGFKKIGLKSKLYERIGNSICVNMVKAVAHEVKKQIILEETDMSYDDPVQFLEEVYAKALSEKQVLSTRLSEEQLEWVKLLAEKEETFKGVYTVVITSLTYKCLHPYQDVRLHQANLKNGYSGRSFDAKFVTPFLKSKQFYGAMKESGWLTRSLEQNIPYDLDYPGKISNRAVKNAFLSILDCIETTEANAYDFLLELFKYSLIEKNKKSVVLINPVTSESTMNITDIIGHLRKHFYYKYNSRGASILPVIALYSVYECIVAELQRYKGKSLDKLASHTSCDKSSGASGDIVVRNSDGSIFEVVEVKFELPITKMMIMDAYKKFSVTSAQRYYILSTSELSDDFRDVVEEISDTHGCQVILNGVFHTLRYYLRLIENTDKFLENYLKNLGHNSEINYEHKIAWNHITTSEVDL